MSTQKCCIGVTLLVWAVVTGWSLSATAISQDNSHSSQSQSADQRPQFAIPNAPKGSRAERIALERYRFLKRLQPRLGFFPLDSDDQCDQSPLFPVGRSGRVYIFSRNSFLPDHNGQYVLHHRFAIFCYQHNHNTDKLLYRINLRPVAGPAKSPARIRSLLDYIESMGSTLSPGIHGVEHHQSWAIEEKISRFAAKDLAVERNYTEYYFDSYISELDTWSLFDLKNGLPTEDGIAFGCQPTKIARYGIEGPNFYKKYGLPPQPEELANISEDAHPPRYELRVQNIKGKQAYEGDQIVSVIQPRTHRVIWSRQVSDFESAWSRDQRHLALTWQDNQGNNVLALWTAGRPVRIIHHLWMPWSWTRSWPSA